MKRYYIVLLILHAALAVLAGQLRLPPDNILSCSTDYSTEYAYDRNSFDFGARILIPAGCWSSADPLATDFSSLSPFSYCGGDPINPVDRDGKWSIEVHVSKDRSQNPFGVAVVYDRHQNELFRFNVRAEGIGGHDRLKENADTPLGKYKIPRNAWINPKAGDRLSYGKYPRLIMEGESGEIIESGRTEIRIHGGKQEEYNETTKQWEPHENPELKRTKGCLRAYDNDVKKLKSITDLAKTIDSKESPEYVNVIDDYDEWLKEQDTK